MLKGGGAVTFNVNCNGTGGAPVPPMSTMWTVHPYNPGVRPATVEFRTLTSRKNAVVSLLLAAKLQFIVHPVTSMLAFTPLPGFRLLTEISSVGDKLPPC
jgi:hypothetical protein